MTKKEKESGRAGRPKRGVGLLRMAWILLLAALLTAITQPGLPEGQNRRYEQLAGESVQTRQEAAGESRDALLTVHYLDVEKCNCVLVQSSDGHFMLIDAGSNDDAHTAEIIGYLQKQGVKTLDFILVTHPHKDHIRAIPQVLDYFSVKKVLMGKFAEEIVDTKTYRRVLEAIGEKGLTVVRPDPGEAYELGTASFTIIANDDLEETAQEEMNNCSIALILTDGIHRFLFYGDGEEEMEEKLVESGFDLACDVMMVAHHGSGSSTKRKMLRAVQPKLAVISCGIDGDGERQEPSQKVLSRLEEYAQETYRTDEDGTIVIESTAEGLYVTTEKRNGDTD